MSKNIWFIDCVHLIADMSTFKFMCFRTYESRLKIYHIKLIEKYYYRHCQYEQPLSCEQLKCENSTLMIHSVKRILKILILKWNLKN